MRIAYVSSDPGICVFGTKGASVHAQAVLGVLLGQGHEVHLLTPRPGASTMPGLHVHTLPAVPKGATAERERAAQASDARVEDVLETLSPDLVYERYSLWGRAATTWAAARGVHSVLEVNAPLVQEQARHRELVDADGAASVARSALSRASAVVCVSEGVATWAREVASRPERVHVVPNGVDVERVTPATRAVTPADADVFTVGFVGTLKAWHGVEVLLDAVASLVADDPSWRLLLVGDGPTAGALRERAERAGVADHVELTGALGGPDVAGALHRMDVACAPYPPQDPFYFSPLKVYEYLAAGLPVVASAVGQVPDALEHGRLGTLVAAGDVGALAAALRELRVDEARRTRLRGDARRAAIDRHTWDAVVDRTLGLVRATRRVA